MGQNQKRIICLGFAAYGCGGRAWTLSNFLYLVYGRDLRGRNIIGPVTAKPFWQLFSRLS